MSSQSLRRIFKLHVSVQNVWGTRFCFTNTSNHEHFVSKLDKGQILQIQF